MNKWQYSLLGRGEDVVSDKGQRAFYIHERGFLHEVTEESESCWFEQKYLNSSGWVRFDMPRENLYVLRNRLYRVIMTRWNIFCDGEIGFHFNLLFMRELSNFVSHMDWTEKDMSRFMMNLVISFSLMMMMNDSWMIWPCGKDWYWYSSIVMESTVFETLFSLETVPQM